MHLGRRFFYKLPARRLQETSLTVCQQVQLSCLIKSFSELKYAPPTRCRRAVVGSAQ